MVISDEKNIPTNVEPEENQIGISDEKSVATNVEPKDVAKEIEMLETNGEGESSKTNQKKKKIGDLFSKQEELILLTGLENFWTRKRIHDWVAFHIFMNGHLPHFTKNQITEKLRRMKLKFGRIREKGGFRHFASNSHEANVYELSKKLWDHEVIITARKKKTNGGNSKSLQILERQASLLKIMQKNKKRTYS
ncbi:hypothetical protein MIMGU_mgv1a020246mg, partial [Erythranthe guttata]